MKKSLYIIIGFFLFSNFIFAVTEITLWSGFSGEVIDKAIKMFETKNPDIKIKNVFIGINQDQYESKINDAEKEEKMPDMILWGPQATGKMAKMGRIVKVQEFIDDDLEIKKEDIFDSLWEASSYHGEIWTVPFDANNLGIYYSMSNFSDAGVDPNSIRNWKDFTKNLKLLTKNDNYGIILPFGDQEWTVWIWETFFWQAGGEFLYSDDKLMLDSGATVNSFRLWQNIINEKSALISQKNKGYGDSITFFNKGKVAMMINGPWLVNSFKNKKVGTIFLPSEMRKATNVGGENIYIFKSNKEKEKASWKFAKFVLSKEFQVYWAKSTGYIPISKSAIEDTEYKKYVEENSILKVFVEQMKYGKVRPSIPEYPEISNFIGKNLELIMTNKISPEVAAENIQEYADFLLKRN